MQTASPNLRLVEQPSDLDPSVEAALAAVAAPYPVAYGPLFNTFDDILATMQDLQASDLLDAAVIAELAEYDRFAADPILWFLNADDRRVARLWRLIEVRRPWRTRRQRKAAEAEIGAVSRG